MGTGVGLTLPVRDGVRAAVWDAVGERERGGVAVPVRDANQLPVGVRVPVREVVLDLVEDCVAEGLAVEDRVTLAVGVTVTVGVSVGVVVYVGEPE